TNDRAYRAADCPECRKNTRRNENCQKLNYDEREPVFLVVRFAAYRIKEAGCVTFEGHARCYSFIATSVTPPTKCGRSRSSSVKTCTLNILASRKFWFLVSIKSYFC